MSAREFGWSPIRPSRSDRRADSSLIGTGAELTTSLKLSLLSCETVSGKICSRREGFSVLFELLFCFIGSGKKRQHQMGDGRDGREDTSV